MRTHEERMELFKSSDLYPVISSEFCNGRSVCEILSGIVSREDGAHRVNESICYVNGMLIDK